MAAPAQEHLRALLHHGAVAGHHGADAVDFKGAVLQGSDLDLAHALNIDGAGASTRVALTGNVDSAKVLQYAPGDGGLTATGDNLVAQASRQSQAEKAASRLLRCR